MICLTPVIASREKTSMVVNLLLQTRKRISVFHTFSLAVLTAFSVTHTQIVNAQTFPSKPIKLVIPFPAGGGADYLGREIGHKLSEALNQPVIIENKTGAAGIVGTTAVARAPADGYTLLIGTTGTHSSNPASYENLSYDPQKDFEAVSIFGYGPFVLCVNAGYPIESIRDLISYSKLNRDKLTYGSAGIGSSTHLGFEQLKQQAGLEIRHVPYKGLPSAMLDTLGGHVAMTFDSIPSALQNIHSKKIRIIGIGSAKRSNLLPGVPTIGETVPGYTLGSWYGVFAPANTPKEVVWRLNAEINKILKSKESSTKLESVGASTLILNPDEARTYLDDDIKRWRKVAQELNIRIQ
jgi:tripartite-type tricarboxylate transporter receptor subunit TctC